ncbi:hypothetical protein MXB_1839 [Myxobolus squamalis]|nr:hypothetical protein MXB_1839 [Myxobolus squamalis]
MESQIEQIILQQFIHFKVMDKLKFKSVLRELSHIYNVTFKLKEILQKLNKKLEVIGFEISYTKREQDGTLIFGFVCSCM